MFTTLEKRLEPVIEALPALTRQSRAEILRGDRMDNAVREALAKLMRALGLANQPEKPIEDLASVVASRTRAHQRTEMTRQVNAAFGIDVFQGNPNLSRVTTNFIQEQVALVKDLPVRTLTEIEGIVIRGVSEGRLHGDIAKEIQKRVNIGKNRAALIARDQVGKFYGVVNRERQKALGLTRFRWRTVGDERVRSKHKHLDGRIFTWDNPPSEGIPGQPINCRCTAEPVFDDILEAL
jgi:SPP1 gp7 family putative phage head morphogenesis protein